MHQCRGVLVCKDSLVHRELVGVGIANRINVLVLSVWWSRLVFAALICSDLFVIVVEFQSYKRVTKGTLLS